ncbi:MAG: hypothetical protein EOO69_09660 [Moraxellaceae bacterium]|nr:MAG: hypothetical protein EOO69_09660 [Moraxellaceae bacterium]
MKKGYSVENFKEIFLNANYILFDPSLWVEAHSELKQLNVQYHLIGLDYFGYESDTPTLINLNRLSLSLKEQMWNKIGKYKTTNSFSSFDKMSMFQNIIYTKLNESELIELLVKLFIINKRKNILRIHDSRVIMHLPIMQVVSEKFSSELIFKINFIKRNIDNWYISLAGNFWQLDFQRQYENYPKFDMEDLNSISENIREILVEDVSDNLDSILEKQYKILKERT